MKKILFIILCLFFLWIPSSHSISLMQLVSVPPASGGGDSCTSGLELTWHMVNADLSLENGCSNVGDSVWTQNSATLSSGTSTDGDGYRMVVTGASQYYILNPTQNNSTNDITIQFDIHLTAFSASEILFEATDGSDDYFTIDMVGDASNVDFRGYWYSQTGTDAPVRVDSNLVAADGKYYRITYEVAIGQANDQRISVQEIYDDDANDSTPMVTTGSPITQTDSDSLTAMTDTPNVWYLGNYSAGTSAIEIDNFKWYSTTPDI